MYIPKTDLPIYAYQLNFEVIFLKNEQSNLSKRSSSDLSKHPNSLILKLFHTQNKFRGHCSNFERPKICFRNLEKGSIVFIIIK